MGGLRCQVLVILFVASHLNLEIVIGFCVAKIQFHYAVYDVVDLVLYAFFRRDVGAAAITRRLPVEDALLGPVRVVALVRPSASHAHMALTNSLVPLPQGKAVVFFFFDFLQLVDQGLIHLLLHRLHFDVLPQEGRCWWLRRKVGHRRHRDLWAEAYVSVVRGVLDRISVVVLIPQLLFGALLLRSHQLLDRLAEKPQQPVEPLVAFPEDHDVEEVALVPVGQDDADSSQRRQRHKEYHESLHEQILELLQVEVVSEVQRQEVGEDGDVLARGGKQTILVGEIADAAQAF